MAVVFRCPLFVSVVLTFAFTSAAYDTSISQNEVKEATVDYVPLQRRPCEPCNTAQASTDGCKKEYLVGNRLSTWYDANVECKMLGQRLLTINSSEEWDQVQRALIHPNPMSNGFWTAGISINSGRFVWASTWEPFNFTSWKDGESAYRGKINCVAIGWQNKREFYWFQSNCNFGKYFICEKCANV